VPMSENIPEILLNSASLGGVTEGVVEGHVTTVTCRSTG
jgi:hypothetical protein